MKRRHTFSATLEKSTNKLWGAHLIVPASIAAAVTRDGSRRVLCSLNGAEERQCALVRYAKGTLVVTVNKKLRESLRVEMGERLQVRLCKDKSRYGLPLPEEFKGLLLQDAEGNRYFHALTAGKRRTLLHIVGSVKDPDIRLTRSLIVIRHLKTNMGKIDYRRLSEMLRNRQPGA